MTTWHWVRHGPTHQKTFTGWRDVPADLSDKDQIARLDAYLPRPSLLLSSDLIRATATADCLYQGRERLAHEPDLREFDFGVWDGMHFDDVSARDPVLSRQFWDQPGEVKAPEGESWNDAARRAAPVVDRLNAAHPKSHIIAVAHFGLILTQLQRASGQSALDVLAQKIDNLSVTTLVHEAGNWRVGVVNHCP